MTIHKSKGLEFHTVIIPFCDWPFTGEGGDQIWCETKDKPYNYLSLLPISCVKNMANSRYKEEYFEEYLYQIVDNLNITYVATTRAKSNLIIFTEEGKSTSYKVWLLINTAMQDIALPGMEKTETGQGKIYRYGEIVASTGEPKKENVKEKEQRCDNPFESESEPLRTPFTFHESRIQVKQSRELARFLATDDEKNVLKNIAEGELMHRVMQEIETADDIDKALDKLMLEGIIEDSKQHKRKSKRHKKRLAQTRPKPKKSSTNCNLFKGK
jgi:ATP-dependent exoDNAse (exonuclease V) beta subunit